MKATNWGILMRAGVAVIGWVVACLLAPDHIGAVAAGVAVGLVVATPVEVLRRRAGQAGGG